MSAFIVISVKDSLNWIVDGIKECRPHNPEVVTYISIGKIKKEGEDKYLYEYTAFSKHAGDSNTDNTLSRTIESDIPRNLFSNQIAKFLNICENEGEQINLFLIDNPITDADFEQSSWIVDEIKAVYESHKATNFQLVRILFTYELDKPTDVNKQASKMILKQLTKINLDDSDDFLTRILYIDNQNRSGAAMCLNKEEHDIMIPRMLCDLMMLMSNKDDSYNVSSAISSQSRIFAVGYAECMYYHDDIFRYYNLAGRRDLLKYLLETINDEESLDYNKYPIGLEDRLRRLTPLYAEVPFSVDISTHPQSIDKGIDDIIVSFKDDIINIRQKALTDAAEKDAKETKSKIIGYLKDNNLVPETVSDRELENRYLSIAEDNNVNLDSFTITTALEETRKKFPEYVDRHQIFEEYLVENEDGEDIEETYLEASILSYSRLIKYIQTGQFKKYIRAQCEQKEPQPNLSNIESEMKPKKMCFLKRLFCRKKDSELYTESDSTASIAAVSRDWHSVRDTIASISEMYSKRRNYYLLKEKVDSMRSELASLNEDIHNFKLTSHCSSVDNLIDLNKLKEFHQSGREIRIKKTIEQWNLRDEKERTYDALFEELKERTKWDLFGFYYIDWSEPFDFIKTIELPKVCEALRRRSQPFVNTYTLEPNAENLTSFVFYTDNENWHEDITQKKVTLKDNNKVSCTLSHHICSKICMFQFLQMSHELIDGLVDCYEN